MLSAFFPPYHDRQDWPGVQFCSAEGRIRTARVRSYGERPVFILPALPFPLFQFVENHRPELRDAASAQGQDHVAVLRDCGGGIHGFGGGTYVAAVLCVSLADALRQGLARNAFDGLLAGGVDVEYEERIGVVKGGGEFLDQVAGAGVAVGLEDDVNLAESALAGRGQRGLDLGRMVAVVVDDAHAGGAAAQLEAAIDAAELIEGGADGFDSNLQADADGNGRC